MCIKTINKLRSTGSSKEKEAILKSDGNLLLQQVLKLAYSNKYKFYMKQVPEFNGGAQEDIDLEILLKKLKPIYERKVTGQAAKNYLIDLLSNIKDEIRELVLLIIQKDLKCGINTKTINKVFKGLIQETPYMGAKPFHKKLVDNIIDDGVAYSEVKMDGRFANSLLHGERKVEIESRRGEPTLLPVFTKFVRELKQIKEKCVLNGEITVDGVDRYTSNGMVASIISITKKVKSCKPYKKDIEKYNKEHCYSFKETLGKTRYTIWDIISFEGYYNGFEPVTRKHRLQKLEELLNKYNFKQISLIEYKRVESYKDVMRHFTKMLNRGEEGTILKSAKGVYKNGKPDWQVKIKLEFTVDLLVFGYNIGTGKNSDLVSSLQCSSKEGDLITNPGGIKEADMEYLTNIKDKLLSKKMIVEVKCSGLSYDKDGNYSLLHPRFMKIRDDKEEANTLDEIQEIQKSIKQI